MLKAVYLFIVLLTFSGSIQAFETIWEERTLVRKLEANPTNQYQQETNPINLNSADKASLQRLKGIGPKKAQAIIDYRQNQGPLKSTNDLLKIKGFTPKILRKIIEKNKSIIAID